MQGVSSPEVVVRLENVSKQFELNRARQRSLMELIARPFRSSEPREYFWPLRDVSFELTQGATLGIVGENGAGKSTILKVIARILEVTGGRVETRGRLAALLELGAGFHSDLTGRENVFLNGSIMGLSRREVSRHLDRIIEFADIGPFIDVPVKHYSSGMRVRLGFSVAVHVQPEIMLVDEVLAVGDEDFQHKCLHAFHDFLGRGGTLILVSHSVDLIRNMCRRTIWLDDGRIQADGPSSQVLMEYLNHVHHRERERMTHEHVIAKQDYAQVGEPVSQANKPGNPGSISQPSEPFSVGGGTAPTIQTGRSSRWGDGAIRIDDVRILNRDLVPSEFFSTGDPFTIEFDYTVHRPLTAPPTIGVAFVRHDGLWCYGTNTQIDGLDLRHMCEADHRWGTVAASFDALGLLPGVYHIDLALQNLYGGDHDYYRSCARLSIRSLVRDTGVVRLAHEWSFRERRR